MIYLAYTTEAQTVNIPADSEKATGTLTFALKSTIDGQTVTSAGVADLSTRRLTYSVAVTLPSSVKEGEYLYELKKGSDVLSSGLATVGNYERTTIQYTEYEQ